MEQAIRRRCLHQRPHLHTAAGLAKQRHILRVTAKGGNVFPDPLEGSDHIIRSRVGRIGIFFSKGGQIQVAQHIQPVVQGNHHHIAVAAQAFPVIGHLLNGGTGKEAAAMEPDHHRFLGTFIHRLRPDI